MAKSDKTAESRVSAPTVAAPPTPLAVIDVGTTSIRMEIAQVDAEGKLHQLDNLHHPVSLGKDTFTSGAIAAETTEDCVRGLSGFCKVLREYHIPLEPRQVRAVATSAVREATNRDAFLDRIFVATGLTVEAVDEAEVNRFTYLSVQPLIRGERLLRKSSTLIIEVGGGSTEMLALRDERVQFSQAYHLGSLRLREMLEEHHAPAARVRDIIDGNVRRTVEQIAALLPENEPVNVLIMGGDARFAVTHLNPGWNWERTGLVRLQVSRLAELTDEVLSYSVDELVRRYHITYPEAETLGPALLTYLRLAQRLHLRRLFVTAITMRDGVLAELASQGTWSTEFTEQILSSATVFGQKCHVDEPHAGHVAALAIHLFRALHEAHHLPARYELILRVAALLHETGRFVSTRNHHHHSMYLITNSDLFGLGSRDLMLTALVVKYHRQELPGPADPAYTRLDRESRVLVAQLAAILRIADALDRCRTQRIRGIAVTVREDAFVIDVRNAEDLTMERVALEQRSQLFTQVYGMTVILHRVSPSA
ncbi:MAG: hypothetical protein A3K19_15930 [Lentisphaerae bacterium RIFOXYB12_FULL_65_16]|nr:MAG: hypothetical protein A3K18_06075 [Lentisphaerae bacterium RIFOXYA12_64_32]OGV87314.1 MAG: hypothetical protein A3K19_15930 [Lentisphaerae bacterium RIFOXYB12_FULL_65_16]